jgi:hypothetical protein
MDLVTYKLFLSGTQATRAQLDRVETIVVEQAMDQLWQATVQVIITADENGRWTGPSEDFLQPLTRVRIEVEIGSNGFVPLIDGPVVGVDGALDAQPGRSLITLRVSDDGYYLLTQDDNTQRSGDKDSDIADDIFSGADHISDTDIEETGAIAADRPTSVMQRYTKMETLQLLAFRNGKHAFVLPGDSSDTSIGCFKEEDSDLDQDLPALVLLGHQRNIDTFSVTNNAQRPSNVQGSYIDIQTLDIRDATTANYADLLGDDQSALGDGDPGVVQASPGMLLGVDPDGALRGECLRRSYAFDAQGTIQQRFYEGVLLPYKLIAVQGIDSLSGNYLIRSVKHTLTRSEYIQEFGLSRRGQSASADSSSSSASTRGAVA